MQRAEKASGFMRALATAQEYVKATGDVNVLDHFDFDVAMPDILDINGSPVEWTRTAEAIKEVREARAQQAQQKMMIENAAGLAAGVGALGKAAEQAPPEQGLQPA